MQAHLAKLSLALLSTVFLLGCQDLGSEPVGPDGSGPEFTHKDKEHGKGGGGGGGIKVGKLGLAGGMEIENGAALLDVFIGKDDDRRLTVNNADLMREIQMNFPQPTLDVAKAGACTVIFGNTGVHFEDLDPEVFQFLLNELTATEPRTGIWMEIDKSGLTVGGSRTSDRHLLHVSRDGTFDNAGGLTRIMLGFSLDDVGVGPATVEWISSIGPEDVFEFTGPVVVWAVGVGGGGGRKSNRAIACGRGGDNDNTVTATVNRSAAN